jgi:hypothetical protein
MRIIALCSVVGLAACVSTNVALLDTSVHHAPVCKEGVIFYMMPDKAPPGYKELALLSSSGESGWTGQDQMVESMRKKAAEIGATGVILNDIKEPGTGEQIAAAILGTPTERHGKAVAIWSEADTARVRQACSPGGQQAAQSSDATAADSAAAALCIGRDSVTLSPDEKTLYVVAHDLQTANGCAVFRRCYYDASVTTVPQALALCRGELKKEE